MPSSAASAARPLSRAPRPTASAPATLSPPRTPSIGSRLPCGSRAADALGAHAADEAAERGGARHARHQRLGRMRVEPFVEQRPIGRDRNRANHGGVEVEEHRRHRRVPAETDPLDDEQRRVASEKDGHHATRAEPVEQPARHPRGGDRQHRGTAHEIRQALDWKQRQDEPIANRIAGHLLRNQRCGSRRSGDVGP
jgi:hypothetical protein